jgi:multiple sugar transport system ATP-binding protein
LRVVVMNGGRIEQAADPITLYEAPRNLFVAAFIGAPSMNFIEGEIVRADGGLAFRAAGDVSLRIPGNREAAYGAVIGQKVVLGIRPEHTAASGDASRTIALKVRDVEPLGPHTLLIGSAGAAPFVAPVAAATRVQPDDVAPVALDLEKMHLFRREGGEVVAVARS